MKNNYSSKYEEKLSPNAKQYKIIAKILGPILIIIGFIFLIYTMTWPVNFSQFERDTSFHAIIFILGAIFIIVGSSLISFGYMEALGDTKLHKQPQLLRIR